MVLVYVPETFSLGSYRVTNRLQVRQFNNIDLDSLRYEKFDGMHKVEPAVDLSGEQIDSKTGEPSASL
jgi:hypothetical protein